MAESDLCHFFIAATFHSLFLSFCVSVFARVWVFLHLRQQNKDFCNVGFKLSVCITVVSLTGLGPCTRADHRSEEHTSELQSRGHLVCRLLLEKKKNATYHQTHDHSTS